MRRREDRLHNRCYELRSVLALIQSSGERSHWDTLATVSQIFTLCSRSSRNGAIDRTRCVDTSNIL